MVPLHTCDVLQDDSLAEAMSEEDENVGVTIQSGFMLEDSPAPDDQAMEEQDSSEAGATPSSLYDNDQRRKWLHPLSQAQSPKQATKDVNALHDVTCLAAVLGQRQKKVKEHRWVEMKMRILGGSGNIMDIDQFVKLWS